MGIATLDLLVELRKVGLSVLEQFAKLVELLKAVRLTNLVHGKAPGVFQLSHSLNQRLIVLQLRVNEFDIDLVLAHESSVSFKGFSDVLGDASHSARISSHLSWLQK